MSTRIYPNREAFIRSAPLQALHPCEFHGIQLADCEACTRYATECDLGGCVREAAHYGIRRNDEGRVIERRLICEQDTQFARSLGMDVVSLDLTYDDVPEYEHSRHPFCQWGHISRWCPDGCNGEPTTYETALDAVGVMPT